MHDHMLYFLGQEQLVTNSLVITKSHLLLMSENHLWPLPKYYKHKKKKRKMQTIEQRFELKDQIRIREMTQLVSKV